MDSCTVLYITMEIASLKILSPKIMMYRVISTSISLNIASTATGSVDEIKDPKARLSYIENDGSTSIPPK